MFALDFKKVLIKKVLKHNSKKISKLHNLTYNALKVIKVNEDHKKTLHGFFFTISNQFFNL